MTNRGDEPTSIYGWPLHLVGKGATITVEIDSELEAINVDHLSNRLGRFFQEIMASQYARRSDMPGAIKSTSIDTMVAPWPLYPYVKDNELGDGI
jgi:hypothetical protein